jgi:hypothetical protein
VRSSMMVDGSSSLPVVVAVRVIELRTRSLSS